MIGIQRTDNADSNCVCNSSILYVKYVLYLEKEWEYERCCVSDSSDFHSIDQSWRQCISMHLSLFFEFPVSVLCVLHGEAVYNYALLVKQDKII